MPFAPISRPPTRAFIWQTMKVSADGAKLPTSGMADNGSMLMAPPGLQPLPFHVDGTDPTQGTSWYRPSVDGSLELGLPHQDRVKRISSAAAKLQIFRKRARWTEAHTRLVDLQVPDRTLWTPIRKTSRV
jgi:hypothetical protein